MANRDIRLIFVLNLKPNVMNIPDLFATPIRSRKVRKNVTAFQYSNGCINIDGMRYFEYSMTDAIKRWRQSNPK